MPWKLVCDLRFHEILQTTIIRQIMKGNRKKSKKLVRIVYKSLCACECMSVVWVIVTYYCVRTYKWCLVYVCEDTYAVMNLRLSFVFEGLHIFAYWRTLFRLQVEIINGIICC